MDAKLQASRSGLFYTQFAEFQKRVIADAATGMCCYKKHGLLIVKSPEAT
jgi:hypothetical protein